jgi:hypothetical protein
MQDHDPAYGLVSRARDIMNALAFSCKLQQLAELPGVALVLVEIMTQCVVSDKVDRDKR